jgi:hypothetical protein
MDDRHDDLGTWLSGWVDPLYPPRFVCISATSLDLR